MPQYVSIRVQIFKVKQRFKWYQGPSWPWSYDSWIYNYLWNQSLSPLMLWVRISIRAKCTPLFDKVCQWLTTGRWFSLGPLVSSTNKTDRHDITKKVALNTIKQTNKHPTVPNSISQHYYISTRRFDLLQSRTSHH